MPAEMAALQMQRAANISLVGWRADVRVRARWSTRTFALMLIASACMSAALASWLPLQMSIATVFLFAGPHNWFEARYFLMRLPARFGRSRKFFVIAFAGIAFLTLAYISLPALYYTSVWAGSNWTTVLGTWTTLMLLWMATLVSIRG